MAPDADRLPRDYRKTLTIAVVLGGLFGPPFAYVYALERRLDNHINETEPAMAAFVREEREARCSIARNVYALCLRTAVACEPVSATCAGGK